MAVPTSTPTVDRGPLARVLPRLGGAGELLIGALIAGCLTYGLVKAGELVLARLSAGNGQERGDAPKARQREASADTMSLVAGGITTPFVSGGEAPIAGDLVAVLNVSPGSLRYSRDVDVQLHRQQDPSPAVDDATVLATARMRYMDHGTFRQIAEPRGDGHYRLSLAFPMPGEWDLELQIQTAANRGELRLSLDLYE